MDHLNLKGKCSLFANSVTSTQAPQDMLGNAQTVYRRCSIVHSVDQKY